MSKNVIAFEVNEGLYSVIDTFIESIRITNLRRFCLVQLQLQRRSDQSWLTASPANGSLSPDQTQSVSVTARCDSSVTVRTGVISIDGNGGAQSVSVASECVALPAAVLGNVNPESLSLTGQQFEFTNTGTISFQNIGNASMNFTVNGTTESDDRISAEPDSGTVPAGESQTIVVSGLCEVSAGSFTYGLTLSGNFAPYPEIPVTTICTLPEANGPDLILSDLTVTNVDPLGSINIRYAYTIQNIGNSDALLDGVSVQAFLSQDDTFNNLGDSPAGGRVLTTQSGSMLAPGAEISGTFQSTTQENPENFTFLTMKVDWSEVLTEIDESNNTIATPVSVN